ncbi:MAG: hypothetical protein AUK43_02835 [Oscillatoriales cyanobacterium CG2_30_40_61]|nr:MAG: hypothetical protein AUK43_02835 [Oscillatoriales cyanobacterium CG2_30_40_61]
MGLGNCQNLMSLLQKEYNIETFIETGTFQGGTAVWASNLFKNVFTIELCQQFYETTSKNYEHIQNIQFLYGHTTEHLKAIIPQLQGSALFWLDAHWSGGITAGQEEECPILEELQIIKASEWEHFILIDDARMFLSPPHAPHQLEQWPAIHEVIEELLTFKRQYIVVIEDAIISVPERAKSVLGSYCQNGITKVWEEYARSFHTLGYPISFENPQTTPVVQTAIAPQAEPDSLQFEGSGEAQVIRRFVTPGSVVLDVGAGLGDWTKAVLSICPDAEIHLFEPIPVVYKDLIKNLGGKFSTAQIIPNSFAIGNQAGVQTFYHYPAQSVLSTFHRRLEVEKTGTLQQPQEIQVLKNTVDNYCIQQNLERINFLKIDVEGGELDVLKGAKNCLKKGKIDYIQFEYGGTYLDAKITLKETFEYLHKFCYVMFKIQGNSLEYKPVFEPSDENYEYSNYLAVNERFRANVLGEPLGLLDVPQLCRQHSITPRGIVHVGAHEGSEVEYYLAMGAQRVLFIEANPTVFERLQTNIAQYPNVQAVNYAISHENGTVTLRVTSFDQSSSILPLKHHLDIYPTIQETEQVTVPSRTLDTLLQELGLNPADFNILNIDIQGAELLALQGATNWLQYVEAINTEVNYKELYEGCALIDDLDEFLDQYGLQRVATTTPHPFWGDAFYVKKPLVTMSILSRARFGNQIFLYAALKIYQKEHDIHVETTPWLGQYLFGHHEPLISKDLPIELDSGLSILNGKEPFKNVEFGGPTYQIHTKYYAPYKDFFRSLFKPIPTIEAKMKEALQRLHERGKTIVGLHLRRGDYREPYADFMFYAPNSCYRNWLRGLWETLESPVLFIASDDLESMLEDFADYHPVTTKDLGIELPEASFYPDFYLLSHCDVLAISNSTFSFAAAMLNERCKLFFRPHLLSKKLIPFDPWDSEPLFWHGRGTWGDDLSLTKPVITASLLGEANFGRLGNKIDPWNSEPLLHDHPEHTENLTLHHLLQVNSVESENSELLCGHHIDAPAVGKLVVSQVLISGWVIGKQAKAVVVELIHQGQVIRQIPVGDIREDVAQSYPDASFALESGYAALIKVPETQSISEIQIQVVLADQIRVKLGVIHFQPTEQKWSVVSVSKAKPRGQFELSISAILKNESPYIIELLEFHKIVGLERFYLYNNNSTDNLIDIIQPYIESGEVILHERSELYQREDELNQVKVELNQSQVGWYREYWKKSNLPTLSLLNQPAIKWFFAISDEGEGFEVYSQMMKVSVLTAKQNTTLEPYCIYDGQENELTEWLRKNGVKVIHYRSSHYDQFKRDIPGAAHVAAGAFLRIEIPKIVQKYGMQDEYVLYTDCDTMFQNDVVDYLKGVTCEYIAAAPEFDPSNWSYLNSGVLYMNIKNLLKIDQEFNNFIMYNLMEIMKWAFDQGAYNLFFKDRWQHLDPTLNWKSYWDLNPNAKVIHFHGPKPNKDFSHDLDLESLANHNYWQNVEVWKDKYQAVEFFSGGSLEKRITEQYRDSEVICQELVRIKAELHQTKEELERSQSQFDEVLTELEEAHGQLHQRQLSQTDLSV